MIPRKRLKTIASNAAVCSTQDCKKSSRSSGTKKIYYTDNLPEFYFSLLPNEIMLQIFQYLSPADLEAMLPIEKRYKNLISTLKEADFSLCHRASSQQVSSYFTRSRVKILEKLNLDYVIFLKTSQIVNLVSRCKNLTRLSVVECGIKYNELLQIMRQCSNLEEVSWTINDVVWSLADQFPKMKTLYLTMYRGEPFHQVCVVLRSFPEIKNVFVNYSKRFTFLKQCSHYTDYCQRDYCMKNPSGIRNGYYTGADDGAVYCNSSPPCALFRSIKEDIVSLSSGPSNAYTFLTVVLTPDFHSLSENLVNCITKVGGYKLKCLTIQADVYERLFTDSKLSEEVVVEICEMFAKITMSCKSITVLDVSTIHFSVCSPFRAICQLENLKTLKVSTCCFKKVAEDLHSRVYDLKDVVSNCRMVENFILLGCEQDTKRIFEMDMYSMKKWKNLKHFTFYNVIFRNCHFLKSVASSCTELESLSLISVAPRSGCLYTEDIIYVLKTAKKLAFIRINERKFNPMYERFWDSVGEAQNLEGICIFTDCKIALNKSAIMSAIRKLKYLHLFHFDHPRITESLHCAVKKSMQEHEVSQIKVERFCRHFLTMVPSLDHKQPRIVHDEPDMCCKHFHLRNLNIYPF